MIFNMQSGGVVPSQYLDEQIITPGTADQVIPAETYLRGDLTIAGDADLAADNIKKGTNIFGVTGTLDGCKVESGTIRITKSSSKMTIGNPFGDKDKIKSIFISIFTSDSGGGIDTLYFNSETGKKLEIAYGARSTECTVTITDETIILNSSLNGVTQRTFLKGTYTWEMIGIE